MAQLMQPPHLERLQDKLALAPILKALLERHFEVNKVIAAAYRCVPLRCRSSRCGAAACRCLPLIELPIASYSR
jgi:hypothetical protein